MNILAVFSGQVLSFLRCCVFFRVFRSRSLQKRSGTCLNASGMVFASNLHMEMCKIIWKSIRSEHFGILQLWEFFCQPFGENTFSKNGPKTKIEKLKKPSSFLSNQITARIRIQLYSGSDSTLFKFNPIKGEYMRSMRRNVYVLMQWTAEGLRPLVVSIILGYIPSHVYYIFLHDGV